MTLLRRAWRVYADPPASEAAMVLRWMIPTEYAAWHYRLFAPDDWPALSGTTLVQVCLWCALLWIVRERDEARAESEGLKQELSTYKIAIQYAPFVVQAVNCRRAEKARDADR